MESYEKRYPFEVNSLLVGFFIANLKHLILKGLFIYEK